MGLLDGDSGLLIGGLASAGQGFIKGMQDAEDRRYKRMEFEAKQRAEQIDHDKKDQELKQNKFRNAMQLRNDWLGNQTTKHSQTIKEAYDKINSATPNAAGDMGLVFGYMKILDPNSTVREGEYANASNTTGVAGKVYQLWNKVKDGQILTPQQRAQFKAEAAKIYAAQQQSQSKLDNQFGDLADRYELPREEIVLKIFEDPETGEQRVVPVPVSQAAPQVVAPIKPQKANGLIKKTSAPAKGGPAKIDDIDKMSDEELKRYLDG